MRFVPVYIAACAVGVQAGPCHMPGDPVLSILKSASAFCSSYLGYPRTATQTATGAAATVTRTETLPPPTVTAQATLINTVFETDYVTVTDTPDAVTVTQTVTAPERTVYAKRDEVEKRLKFQLPPGLANIAASKISSACSRIVTPSTKTVTKTVPNANPVTAVATVPAGNTDTVIQTVTVEADISVTVTSRVTALQQTETVTAVVTPILTKPKICNAQGLPGANAFNYDANFNTNQAACIASCKTDNRCLATGFYLVTNPTTGTTSGTCRKYDKAVANSADLGFGYYNFNDKAC